MSRIFKYALSPFGRVEMPVGARILTVHEQGDGIFIWAEVNPDAAVEERRVMAVPTGGFPPDDGTFLGTAFLGDLVFHVYEAPKP